MDQQRELDVDNLREGVLAVGLAYLAGRAYRLNCSDKTVADLKEAIKRVTIYDHAVAEDLAAEFGCVIYRNRPALRVVGVAVTN